MISLLYLGFTRQDAPLALRERLHLDADAHQALQRDLASRFGECLILTTCERVEFYVTATVANADDICKSLSVWTGVDADPLRAAATTSMGFDAAHHLIRVAAGLESRIVGEPHILRQVRQSYLRAKTDNVIGPVLDALIRSAIHTGKVVRRDIYSPTAQRTLAQMTVQSLLCGAVQESSRVLLLGTGDLAADVLDELTRCGIRNVTIVSRQLERARRLCRIQTHRPATIDEIATAVTRIDAAITCARSESPLIDANTLAHVNHPMTIFDLGVPRNVDPNAANVPAVTLTHLDELSAQCIDVRTRRSIETVARRQLHRFKQWYRARSRAHLIARCDALAFGGNDRATRERRHLTIMRIKEHAA